MVRPTPASLNSLADILRRAQPLYAVCRSIINYIDSKEIRENSFSLLMTPQVSVSFTKSTNGSTDVEAGGSNGIKRNLT